VTRASLPRGWIWRSAAVVLPFTIAVLAFRAGVHVTYWGDLAALGLLTQMYAAAALFVLGGMDLGVPTGGPPAARAALWVVYFAAPVITTGAVAEGILRSVRPAWLQLRGLHHHVVLVGLGSLGTLYLQGLRDADPRRQVLIVDRDGGGANATEAASRSGVRLVRADIKHRRARLALRLERAAGVVVMTKDDLVNLEAAWDLLDDYPDLKIVVHVADIGMRRRLGRLVDEGETRVRTFNSHRIAARRLWDDSLRKRFEETAAADSVVLAGFGRFGQTIAEYLREHAGDGLGQVVVLDRDATRLLEAFTDHVGAGWHDPRFSAVDGDLDEPRTWEAVHAALGDPTSPPSYVLGVDDDRTNLRAAARVRTEDVDAPVYVRCFHQSRFIEEMAAEHRLEVLSLERLLREAFCHEHERWFGKR